MAGPPEVGFASGERYFPSRWMGTLPLPSESICSGLNPGGISLSSWMTAPPKVKLTTSSLSPLAASLVAAVAALAPDVLAALTGGAALPAAAMLAVGIGGGLAAASAGAALALGIRPDFAAKGAPSGAACAFAPSFELMIRLPRQTTTSAETICQRCAVRRRRFR